MFHFLKIVDLKKETKNAISVSLKIPERLSTKYFFQAGQYLSIKHELNGEEIIRDYSLSSKPEDDNLRICIKKVRENGFSAYAQENLTIGGTLSVSEPRGKFTIGYRPDEKRTVICFAAGSGITPIISHIRVLLEKEKGTDIFLFYGNSEENNIIYKEELENLASKNNNFHLHHFLTESKTERPFPLNGRINKERINLLINQKYFDIDEVDKCLICGPEEMIIETAETILENGIPAQDIHFELFTTPTLDNPLFQNENTENNEGKKIEEAELTVDVDFDTYNLKIDTKQSILDQLLEEGIDAPYSCKGGVCSSCQCKILEGSVKMDKNMILTESEVESGWALACQSIPTSSRLVISFDEG